jgi:predicted DNA-binding transcriptional regulator YafY
MRRADRLFQIIQILRRSTRPVTSSQLATELEVSKRTVYRDVADLMGQRVPIEGEAGLGYLLDPKYDMPPLMLTADEIEAVVLGAQLVAKLPDAVLANAANDVVAKIAFALPKDMLPYLVEPGVAARPSSTTKSEVIDMRPIRAAIREGLKLRLRYRSEAGEVTGRTVWPVILGYSEAHCLLVAWCETKQAFRHFRTDRMLEVSPIDERFGMNRSQLRRRWEHWRKSELQTFRTEQRSA